MAIPHILTINGGSSSIKFALFSQSHSPQRIAWGLIDRMGTAQARLITKEADKTRAFNQAIDAQTSVDAVTRVVACVSKWIGSGTVAAVAHRVVHGGPNLLEHQVITPKVIAELKRIQPLDMAHLPGEIALITAFQNAYPGIPHIACLDTAFHRDMPRAAQLLPIPRAFLDAGVRRFGFHGLSYTFLMKQLATLDKPASQGRVILAHLGSGASMAAVKTGKPMDTTMAFTPTAGLMMGTRPGDMDPGFLVYLLREKKMTAGDLDTFINKRCGLLGVSGISGDMRDILKRMQSPRTKDRVHAQEAFDLFCHQARRHIGALATTLDGLDTLVFAGGIGEHAPQVRAAVCTGLGFLGIRLSAPANAASRPVISTPGSRVIVRVIATDEEIVMAQTATGILSSLT